MIEDFDNVKKQIKELAAIINEFKSESVQLRVLELLFEKLKFKIPTDRKNEEPDSGKKKQTKNKPASKSEPNKKKAANKRTTSGGRPGPGTIINQLIGEGFFKKPKVAKDIVSHCNAKKGYKYNTSELNVGLLRALRSQTLQRKKNDKSQFEYFEQTNS